MKKIKRKKEIKIECTGCGKIRMIPIKDIYTKNGGNNDTHLMWTKGQRPVQCKGCGHNFVNEGKMTKKELMTPLEEGKCKTQR